jgi:hypothetical protein
MPNENHLLGGILSVAGRQWGCVTVAQLLAGGFTRRQIEGMAERGVLHRMHRGVYVFGALSPAPEQRWAAALLAAGKGAVLSHTTAAAHYGLLPPRDVIEVSAPRKRRGDERLRIHERRTIDLTRQEGLPTTTVAQTLLDLAAAKWPIDRLTQEAAATNLVPLDALRAFAAQRRGARGAAALAEAAGQPLVRSRMEYEVMRKLGAPEANAKVGFDEADLLWRDEGLVIELDTDQTHGAKWARERDERKDQRLRARGLEVRRFTV